MLSESGVYGKRGAIPFFFEAPAFIVTSVMRSITFPKVSGKPRVPVAANHSRIKLVRKVSALF